MNAHARPPRLLLLADTLRAGGRERQTLELLKGLRRSGRFTTSLGVLEQGGAFAASAAAEADEVLPLRRRWPYDVSPAIAVLAAAGRHRVDLVQATGWMSGWTGLLAARCHAIPLVYAALADQPLRLHRRARLSRACAVRADATVANGEAALAAYGLRGHPRVVVIPNGIDLDRFAVTAEPGSLPSLCMVANFNERKDHVTAVRALALVRRSIADAELVLIGQEAGTLGSVKALVGDLGLGAAVRFVTDTIAPEPWIARCHVGVLSSPTEGVSNALLEYMAASRPAVATECAGNAEVVVDGETGFLVPFGSCEQLAERVVALLRDPARARAMGRAGRRRVEERFSLQRMVQGYEDLYARLLARKN